MVVDPIERLRAANPEPWCPPPPIEDVWRRIEVDGRLAKDRAVTRPRRLQGVGIRLRSLGGVVVALSSVVAVVISVAAIALLSHGRGRSPTASRGLAVHVNGKPAQGSYVFETDSSGRRFLVPAALSEADGSRAYDVVSPKKVTVGEPTNNVTVVPSPYRFGVAFAGAVVPHATHVEILATGEPGRRFALSWEETCGWTQDGKAADGGTGGAGLEILRIPAVALVTLPRINGGVPSCNISATAATKTFTRSIRLAIIDY